MYGANRQSNLHVFIYPNTQIHLILTNGLLGCSLYTLCANLNVNWHTQNYKYEGENVYIITDRLIFR